MFFALLITFALAACVTGLICLGAVIAYKGFRGRMVDAHRHCGRCRYDLTGHPDKTERCPECGSNLGSPGMVRRSIRQPQKRLITIGLALIVFNIGGLTGAWKLGELRQVNASLAAPPRLANRTWNIPTRSSADLGVHSESVSIAENDISRDSPQPNEGSYQGTKLGRKAADRTIQLSQLPIATSKTSESAWHDWSGTPGVWTSQHRRWDSAMSSNSLNFDLEWPRSPREASDLRDPRVDSPQDSEPKLANKSNSTPPVDLPDK